MASQEAQEIRTREAAVAAGLVLDEPEAPPSASATDVMNDLSSALERLRVAFSTPTSGLGAPGPAEEVDKDMDDADATEQATPPTKRLKGFVAASQQTTAPVNKPGLPCAGRGPSRLLQVGGPPRPLPGPPGIGGHVAEGRHGGGGGLPVPQVCREESHGGLGDSHPGGLCSDEDPDPAGGGLGLTVPEEQGVHWHPADAQTRCRPLRLQIHVQGVRQRGGRRQPINAGSARARSLSPSRHPRVTDEMLDNEMAILTPLHMQALPSEEVANEGARALRKVNLSSNLHLGAGYGRSIRWVLFKADVTKAHREGLAVSSGLTGGRMVGEQGRHIWHGQCPILLGTPGSPSAQGPLRTFPSSGLAFPVAASKRGGRKLGGGAAGNTPGLGHPSWKKTHLAEVNTWLGFVVHPNIPQVLMAANKHILVMEVLQTMVEGQAMHSKDIEKALGRIQWATAACGEVDAPATLGLEDGHHHSGEAPQDCQDAGVHAAVPLQHALRPVLPLPAEVLLVGLQRC